MRILLDECVDRRLAGDLQVHDVRTVSELGWSNMKDGELLDRAQHQFDVLLTVDQNLLYQHLPKYNIAVVILRVPSNRLIHLKPLVPLLQAALQTAVAGPATIIDDR